MTDSIVSKTEELLGTVIEIKLPHSFSFLFPICFDELRRIERKYSRFLDNSELSIVNAHLGTWRVVSREFLMLLEKAVFLRKQTNGYFDITLKSTLVAIGYGKKSYTNYSSFHTLSNNLLSVVSDIIIDKKNSRVLLRKEIDFGGFGKGYALDKVAEILNAHGVEHYYINAGGDICAKKRPDEKPWEILLEHPDDATIVIGKISLDAMSIAGSAPNRRVFDKGRHLINAKTKKSANDCKAIFVLSKTGLEADAYATALFTAGFKEAIRLAKKLPVEIFIISPTNQFYQSPGFKAELY